jgi:uncharacterized membrane protein YcgQ (UPF0703/DUF1980 family)
LEPKKKNIINTVVLAFIVIFAIVANSGCRAETSGNQDTIITNSNGTQAVNLSHTVLEERIEGEVINIGEKLFIAQMNDIYLNTSEYLGKTIRYEGVYTEYTAPDTGIKYRSVIRYGPGCCGIDGNSGLEVSWSSKTNMTTGTPKPNDWVYVSGALREYEENGQWYLQLQLDEIKTLVIRGAENVKT